MLKSTTSCIKIAWVVYNFNVGGLERFVANLANRVDRRRFQPHIICLKRNGTASQWIQDSEVNISEIRKSDRNDFGAIRRLARTLREWEIDVVHSHNWGTLVETCVARRWAGTPIHVHAERGLQYEQRQQTGWKNGLRTIAGRWALNRSDLIAVPAYAIRDYVQDRFAAATAIEVIPNGVTRPPIERERRDIRTELGIPESSRVIGSVGRLVPVKNFDGLVRSFAKARNDLDQEPPQDHALRAHPHLILVGDGPELDTLRQLAGKLKVDDSVHLVGNQQDVGSWLNSFDIYANVSHSEGASQSLLEAQSVGLPAVVSDVGDNRFIVGEAGWVTSGPGDDDLSDTLLTALRCESLEARQRTAQDRHSSEFTIERMTANYESLYSALVAAKH